ncbi:MAG TPA: hypothetical protein VER78_00020 [Thermoanaerobaculia bacterium]|nr:hypothetical protein [Thermoanaerobaculia bacterium]
MKHSRWPLFLAAASIALLGASESGGKGLSPEDRKHLLSGKLTVARKTSELPPKMKAAFATLVKQPAFEMAEPEQPFQVGDAIAPGPPLPVRRLVLAAFDETACFVHYERGGVAHLYYVVAFGLEKGKDPVFRSGTRVEGRLEDLSTLREAVAAGKLHENVGDFW